MADFDPRAETLRQPDKDVAPQPAETVAYSGSGDTVNDVGLPQVRGYELLSVLGRGGMGVVYRARDTRLQRLVALKMIRSGAHAGSDERERFRTEALAVARLKHPGIVQIYEVSESDDSPYLALEFIEGESLDERLRGTALTPTEAAQLVEQLAAAVEAAHAAGVVHRDLKPANVLLDMQQRPKITDFGLAKQLDDHSGQTHTGQIMGTPSYMAPEQAAGKVHDLGPLVDVYALGAILYEALTGRPPFKGATVFDTLEQVRGRDPVRPSQLQPKVPRDLETICLKCLAKEPRARYASAAALRAELARFLAGEPILARPVGTLERAVKWSQRRPVVAGLLATVVLVTIAGFAGVLYQLNLTRLARDEANQNAGKFKTASELAEKRAGEARAEAKKAVDAKQKESVALEQERLALIKSGDNLYTAHMNLVRQSYERAELDKVRDLLLQHIPKDGEPDRRGFEWFYYWNELHSEHATLDGLPGPVRALSYSTDGKWLAIACETAVLLWNTATQDPPAVLEQTPKRTVALAFQPGTHLLAYASGKVGEPGEVTLRDVASGEVQKLAGHTQPVLALAFSRDGKRLATSSVDNRDYDGSGYPEQNRGLISAGNRLRHGEVLVWDIAKAQVMAQRVPGDFVDRQVTSLAFSDDGAKLIGGSADGQLLFWSLTRGKLLDQRRVESGSAPVQSLEIGEGHVAIVGTGGSQLGGKVYRMVADGESIRMWDALESGGAGVLACKYSPGREWFAVAGLDRTVRVWEWRESRFQLLTAVRGHNQAVQAIAFSPDARFMATGGWDSRVKIWAMARTPGAAIVHQQSYSKAGAPLTDSLSPDENTILVSQDFERIEALDAETLELKESVLGNPIDPMGARFSHYTRFAQENDQSVLELRPLFRGNEPIVRFPYAPLTEPAKRVVIGVSPNRRWLVRCLVGTGGEIIYYVHDIESGKQLARRAYGKGGESTFVTSSPFGKLIFLPDSSGFYARNQLAELAHWSLPDLRECATVKASQGYFNWVDVSPQGQHVATGDDGGNVVLWNAGDLTEVHRFPVNTPITLWQVRFSPDGRMLAVAGRDQSLRILDLASGEERMVLPAGDDIYVLTFAPDSRTIIAATGNGLLKAYVGAEPTEAELSESRTPQKSPIYLAGRHIVPPRRWAQWHRYRAIAAAEHPAALVHGRQAESSGLLSLDSDAVFQYEMGIAEMVVGDRQKAMPRLRLAIEGGLPDAWQSWHNLAKCAALEGDAATVVEAYPQVLEHYSQKNVHVSWVGEFALLLAATPEAVEDWTAVVACLQKPAYASDKKVQQALAIALFRAGDIPGAIARLEPEVRAAPEEVWLLLALLQANHRQGMGDAFQYRLAKARLDTLRLPDKEGHRFWDDFDPITRRLNEVLEAEAEEIFEPKPATK